MKKKFARCSTTEIIQKLMKLTSFSLAISEESSFTWQSTSSLELNIFQGPCFRTFDNCFGSGFKCIQRKISWLSIVRCDTFINFTVNNNWTLLRTMKKSDLIVLQKYNCHRLLFNCYIANIILFKKNLVFIDVLKSLFMMQT